MCMIENHIELLILKIKKDMFQVSIVYLLRFLTSRTYDKTHHEENRISMTTVV